MKLIDKLKKLKEEETRLSNYLIDSIDNYNFNFFIDSENINISNKFENLTFKINISDWEDVKRVIDALLIKEDD